MKSLTTFLFMLIASFVFAQETQAEIDEQVWIPFTKAWEANDAEAYNAIHSDDVWRINPGRLLIGNEYKNENTSRMNGQSRGDIIEFSFETRTSNGDNAYEVGYYRITAGDRMFVGRFHVAMKKIDGAWKITQDWDTGEINGERITAESLETRNFIHYS